MANLCLWQEDNDNNDFVINLICFSESGYCDINVLIFYFQ